jgi:DNA-binding transcriptional regulator YiaG
VTLPVVHRSEYRNGPATGRRFCSSSDVAVVVNICRDDLWSHSSHSRRVALRFCKSEQRSEKPKPKGYPLEPKTIGDHIKKRRLDLKLFQRQVAEQLGVDETTIHNWERNFNSPDRRFVPKIIQFLGYTPSPHSV